MKVIQVVEFANGEPCPIAGQYLREFDFEAENGRGSGKFTHDIRKAKTFIDTAEAAEYWRTQSKTVPMRADGKPNRPLTGCTIVIEDGPW